MDRGQERSAPAVTAASLISLGWGGSWDEPASGPRRGWVCLGYRARCSQGPGAAGRVLGHSQRLLWGKTATAALKLLELSKDKQSTSWPSGNTDGTKTQQGCRALHPHQINFLNKEHLSLRCQVSSQNGLKCFETALENWTYPKQNHPSPQVSTRLSVHYLLLTIQSFLAATQRLDSTLDLHPGERKQHI